MAIDKTYMGGAVYGGIQLANGFDLQAKAPLDSRDVVPEYAGLQALIDGNAAYEGMVVYDEETKKHYKATLTDGVLVFQVFGADAEGYATEEYVDNAIANIGPVAGLWEQVEGEGGIRVKGAKGSASGNMAITNGDDKTSSAGVEYKSIASGDRAVSFGYGNTCSGRATLAQGLYNTVSKNDSAAIGQKNVVDGAQSFAAGMDNQITAMYSNAFGYMNKVTATNGLAAGYKNTASGTGAVALGDTCEAQGASAIALGYKTISGGHATATMGANTKATNRGEVAMGEFNESNTSEDPAQQTSFSFGVGTSDTERANAFEIKKNGDIYFGGTKFESEAFATKAYVEALIGEVENGTYG